MLVFVVAALRGLSRVFAIFFTLSPSSAASRRSSEKEGGAPSIRIRASIVSSVLSSSSDNAFRALLSHRRQTFVLIAEDVRVAIEEQRRED